MFSDITEFFDRLISQSGSYDIAIAEFQHLLADDAALREEYEEWCDSEGYNPRTGFAVYCKEKSSQNDSVWDALNDYDE